MPKRVRLFLFALLLPTLLLATVLEVGAGEIRRHMLYAFLARVYRWMITPLIRDVVLVKKY